MQKQETFFPGACFPVEVIDAATALLDRLRDASVKALNFDNLTIASGHSVYTFDKLTDWLPAYSDGPRAATIRMAVPSRFGNQGRPDEVVLELSFQDESGIAGTSIAVAAAERSTIQSVLAMRFSQQGRVGQT